MAIFSTCPEGKDPQILKVLGLLGFYEENFHGWSFPGPQYLQYFQYLWLLTPLSQRGFLMANSHWIEFNIQWEPI